MDQRVNSQNIWILSLLAVLLVGSFFVWKDLAPENQDTRSPDRSALPESSPSSLSSDSDDYENEAQMIRSIGEKEGAKAAYEKLKKMYPTDQVRGHDLAHTIGRLAYAQEGIDGFATICDVQFSFGCYHGFLAELIKTEGLQQGIAVAEGACNKLLSSGGVASCLHGLGHGVMAETLDISQAITECRQLKDSHPLYCYDGSYMEYYSGVMAGDIAGSEAISAAEPWKFCLSQPESAQTQCVRNHTHYLLYGPTPKMDTLQNCTRLEKTLGDFCIQSVGLFATQNSHTPALAPETLCRGFVSSSDQFQCMAFAAKEIVFEGKPIAEAVALCNTLEADGQTQCLAAVEETKQEYRRE